MTNLSFTNITKKINNKLSNQSCLMTTLVLTKLLYYKKIGKQKCKRRDKQFLTKTLPKRQKDNELEGLNS
ncbi:hypothetical protein GT2_17_00620 [Parageobacillus thermoglucosidasius NBRC 107763]|nr:hypothetical protein GT2_17_00620 [Parageobacillus thermoglucosidasius NBRC 107763]